MELIYVLEFLLLTKELKTTERKLVHTYEHSPTAYGTYTCTHTGVLFNLKKEGHSDRCCNIDETQ